MNTSRALPFPLWPPKAGHEQIRFGFPGGISIKTGVEVATAAPRRAAAAQIRRAICRSCPGKGGRLNAVGLEKGLAWAGDSSPRPEVLVSVSGDDSREAASSKCRISLRCHSSTSRRRRGGGWGGCVRGRPGVSCWGDVILPSYLPPRGGLEHTGDWGLVQEPHGGCCFLSQLIPPIDPLMASYAGKDIVSEPDDGNVSWGVTTASSASCSPMRARHYIQLGTLFRGFSSPRSAALWARRYALRGHS